MVATRRPSPTAGPVKVVHGANDGIFDVAGAFVARIRASLTDAFNIPDNATPLVNGEAVLPTFRLRPHDTLEFVQRRGRKAVGDRVWTGEEFCQFFKVSPDDLQAWIAQGLKVKRCLDGSVRITETALDEFNRGRVQEAPLTSDLPREVNTEQAAAILGLSKDTVLKLRAAGLLEFRNAAPPGSSRPVYRFPLESVVRLRTTYETDEPAPEMPKEPSRRAKGRRKYKYIDFD